MLSKRLQIGQRIMLGFLAPFAALIAIGWLSLRNVNQLQSDNEWVTHTVEVISELRVFSNAYGRIESANRLYLLSGDAGQKQIADTETQNALGVIARLRDLTADNDSQKPRLAALNELVTRRASLSEQMAVNRGAGNDASLAATYLKEGQDLSAQVDSNVQAIDRMESDLLRSRRQTSEKAAILTRNTVLYGSLLAVIAVLMSGAALNRSITGPIAKLRISAAKLGQGDYSHRVEVPGSDEIAHLGNVFNAMGAQIQERQDILAEQDWLKGAQANFALLFQQPKDIQTVCRAVLQELARLVHAEAGALYTHLGPAQPALALAAAYAADNAPATIAPGQGLVGQAYLEKRRFTIAQTPPDYLSVSSALGRSAPAMILVEPVLFENRVIAVLEIASLSPFTARELQVVQHLGPSLGIVLTTVAATQRTEELLRESQTLTAELGRERQKLADQNAELADQADRLRKSEIMLQEQQLELQQSNEELEQSNEELQQSNEEMEEKTGLLSQQKRELEQKNQAIEHTRLELADQARQLAITSKYKSDFLATMSHELRTPLNSLLILARLLSENREANLTPKQVQFAETIASSGADLLDMINQILDLAKIESGTVELELEEVPVSDLQTGLENQFRPVAEQKGLTFQVDMRQGLPSALRTDPRRLNQVLKNLLSNAFKFTDKGAVMVEVRPIDSGWPSAVRLGRGHHVIAIAVRDTGIGIAQDKQKLVFESFQQADAGTARKYGGTGLGLSISRELTALLGGAITLESEPGRGSTFTLYLPVVNEGPTPKPAAPPPLAIKLPSPPQASSQPQAAPEDLEEVGVSDDRSGVGPGDRVILIIEDDDRFARILSDFAREKGFKVLAARSATAGLALAQRYLPMAITLDLRLSDEAGWLVLDRLKHDARTRHIPVHVISVESARERGLGLGAVSVLQKPVTREAIDEILQQTVDFIERPVKNLLVIEDDDVQRESIRELIGNGDVHTTAVATANEALEALGKDRFDCIVLDLRLPDMPGADLIREVNKRMGAHTPPVIIYTGKDLTPRDETELRSLSESIIIKDAKSPERLLDETALFLHRVQARLPESKRRMLEQVRKQDSILTGRSVLVVDDDVRNIFALTAALEAVGMLVRFAESGQAAIDLLKENVTCDVVLMDIMMPGMDGYEAIRRIREDPRFAKTPIIAVTAKAMRGDRERCIEAGASDYITKPVITEKLLSLLRVWLYR